MVRLIGFFSSVIVSPMRQSETLFILAFIKPISPGPKKSTSSIFGLKIPTRSIIYVAPVAINLIFCPFNSLPSITPN